VPLGRNFRGESGNEVYCLYSPVWVEWFSIETESESWLQVECVWLSVDGSGWRADRDRDACKHRR